MNVPPQRIVSGDEWEVEIVALLGRRYNPGEFIEVPADDRGDLGIDGIGRDGVVYQCYSPKPCTNKELKEHLKGKVYGDLRKLIAKRDEHKALLDGIVVKCWMLVTPRIHSKDIQVYANAQAAAIRGSGCDYIARDFVVTVSTDAFLAAERKALVRGVLAKLELDIEVPTEQALSSWTQRMESPKLINTLRTKLSAVASNATRLDSLERKCLHNYLLASNLVDTLQNQYPQLFEAVVRVKGRFETQLELRSELSDDPPRNRLLLELTQYESDLGNELSADLDALHVTQLAQGDVADWLMRCPLSFSAADDET